MWVEPASGYLGNDVPGQPRRGLGKAKHVDMQNSWVQEAYMAGKFVTKKKVGTNVNPADLMTKPLPRPKIVQLVEIVFYRFVQQYKGHRARPACSQQFAK